MVVDNIGINETNIYVPVITLQTSLVITLWCENTSRCKHNTEYVQHIKCPVFNIYEANWLQMKCMFYIFIVTENK